MKKLIIITTLLLCVMPNIYAQKTTTTTRMQDTQARVLDASSSAYVVPLTVELQVVGERIEDPWYLTKQQAEVEMFGDLTNIRSWAVYMSTSKHKVDVIVAPTFNVQTSDDGKGYDIKVIGFPAKYVNWKSATASDYEWIRMEKIQTTKDSEKISPVVK